MKKETNKSKPSKAPKVLKERKIKNVIDGKDREAERKEEEARQERALETTRRFWGLKKVNYTTLESGEYEKSLRKMATIDLYGECQRIGIVPGPNNERNIANLMKKFNTHVAGVKTAHLIREIPREVSEKTMEILRRRSS